MKLDRSDIKTEEILDWKGIHLFHFSGSACSQKLRIFFNIKKINWNSHVINLIKQEQFSKWFLGINPRGLVQSTGAKAYKLSSETYTGALFFISIRTPLVND